MKRVCLAENRLPGPTMAMAATLARKRLGPTCDIWCVLEQHGQDTAHAGCVIDISHAFAVWAAWREGEAPAHAVVLPFCPARKAGAGCSGYRNHPGGHTWELRNTLDR
jgi:hypothetical protein